LLKPFHVVVFFIPIFLALSGLNPAYAVENTWRRGPVAEPFPIASLHIGQGHFALDSEPPFGLSKSDQVTAALLNSQETGGEKPKPDPQITALRVMLPIAGALIGGLYGSAHSSGSQPGAGAFWGGMMGFLGGVVYAIEI